MGTVVFPDAEVKVFLVADVRERARRRMLEQSGVDPTPQDLTLEVARITERDERDAGRALSPLRRPDDAVDLDTTELTFEAQVSAVMELVRSRTASLEVDGPPRPV